MKEITTPQLKIDGQILIINKIICAAIDKFGDSERGLLSQTILASLRNFVEHIMLKIYASGGDIDNSYDNICKAVKFVESKGNLKFLWRFHNLLQISVSHYTNDEENSERLMLKYYEFLFRIREFMEKKHSLCTLENLEKFPVHIDADLKEYYEKIAEAVNRHHSIDFDNAHTDRFYIKKIKPFFVGHRIYYEVTFTSANETNSKFDRIIAFTALDISQFYAARLYVVADKIKILDKNMPIAIIGKWEVSIRPCEIKNFAKIFGADLKKYNGGNPEYRELMSYLTETGLNLVELIDFSDIDYRNVRERVAKKTVSLHFFEVLNQCRDISKRSASGVNVIRYLLYHLNNKIIKSQYDDCYGPNSALSNLCLKQGCRPFDTMPFSTSLVGHNPKLSDILDCIDLAGREHELLARVIKINTEIKGQIYTPVKDIAGFADINVLIAKYNGALYRRHGQRRLEIFKECLYMQEYQSDTLVIVKRLAELAQCGIKDYSKFMISWLPSYHGIDCDEKREALTRMFEKSHVAMIYGSAGTGKTTLINHISHLFPSRRKLYLANTNPAVDNLRRRITASNCEYKTVTKFTSQSNIHTEYDLLIVDECSTVSNSDMCKILAKAKFKLLVLVGDIYQIESIHFGNWFSVARSFIPPTSIFELNTPYRSKSKDLLELWRRVRNMDDTLLEHITKKGYSAALNASIFDATGSDEIILCLNYDGLYGINNVNRFLQEANPNPATQWGMQMYKINDPILFNESERFAPLIYNNMKGRIVGVKAFADKVQFDIELDKVISGLDAEGYDFTLLGMGSKHSVIRFSVDKYKSTDEDDDAFSPTVIPFQVAYAVSIHKAQGLEYDSVKIVISDEVDELITHNIFYTAITRAREKLKIYWTPEVEKKILSRIKPKCNGKDVALLRNIM